MFDAPNEPALPETHAETTSEGVTLLLDLTQIVLAQPPVIQALFVLGIPFAYMCAVVAKYASKVVLGLIAHKKL